MESDGANTRKKLPVKKLIVFFALGLLLGGLVGAGLMLNYAQKRANEVVVVSNKALETKLKAEFEANLKKSQGERTTEAVANALQVQRSDIAATWKDAQEMMSSWKEVTESKEPVDRNKEDFLKAEAKLRTALESFTYLLEAKPEAKGSGGRKR